MNDTDKDPQQNIEKCAEEIKRVLKKYNCFLETYDHKIQVYSYSHDHGIFCKQKDFNK